MKSQERILKMLEDGKITADEAYKLLQVADDSEKKDDNVLENAYTEEPKSNTNTRRTFDSDEREDSFSKKKNNNSESRQRETSNEFEDTIRQFTREFQEYVNPEKMTDKVTEALNTMKSSFDNQKQARQFFDSIERAFDTVKKGEVEHVFSGNGRNKLIETISEPFDRISVDITHGDIKVVPTSKVTTAKFEVKPFYNTDKKKKNHFKDVICEVKNGELLLISDLRVARVNLELHVNENDLKRLLISGTNGNVKIRSLDFNDISVDTMNGSIDIDDVNAHQVFARTSRGGIKVEGGHFNQIELITKLGKIEAHNTASKDIVIHANSSVDMKLNERVESIFVETNMGSVNLTVPRDKALEGRLSTVLGSVIYPPDINVRPMKYQDVGLKEIMLINDSENVGVKVEAHAKLGSITLHRQ